MTYSFTTTSTFTTTDVKRVIDYFTADFDMIAQSTGLRTRENVQQIASDIRKMAEAGYLEEVNLYLVDGAGITRRAAKYVVTESASLWSSDKPSKNLWPQYPGGQLMVHVTYNSSWSSLTLVQRLAFQATYSSTWGYETLDTTFPMLMQSSNQKYSSNSYGLAKTTFT